MDPSEPDQHDTSIRSVLEFFFVSSFSSRMYSVDTVTSWSSGSPMIGGRGASFMFMIISLTRRFLIELSDVSLLTGETEWYGQENKLTKSAYLF